MKLTTPIQMPAVDEVRAVDLAFPDTGTSFAVAFYVNGREAFIPRARVLARNDDPSIGVSVNPARTSGGDAFTSDTMPSAIPRASDQLQQAVAVARAGGADADASRDVMLAKAIDLGLVSLSA